MGKPVMSYHDLLDLLPFAWWWLVIALAVIILLSAAAGWFGGPRHRADDLEKERVNSPRWATPRDVKDLICSTRDDPDPRRVRLGMLHGKQIRNPVYRSKMVVAPAGAGKTPRIVVADVLGHRGPAVVASVKSDVLHLTRHHRATMGPVWIFDPSNTLGLGRCRWSPLAGITGYGDAARAARWLCESSKTRQAGLEGQQYWDTLGRRMLAPLLFVAARQGDGMATIGRWIQTEDEETVKKLLRQTGDTAAIDAWAAHCSTHEKTRSSIYGTAWAVMESWAHPDIAAAVDTTAGEGGIFDVAKLVDGDPGRPGTLYMVAPAHDQELFTPVFETLTNAIVMEVEKTAARRDGVALDPPVLLMLDEAANIAPIRKLDQVASKSAGEGLVVVSVWQDEGQLEVIYGKERARVVISNHYSHVFLPGINDHETLRMVSDRIGQESVQRQSTSIQRHDGASRTLSTQEIDIAPPAWLRSLPSGEAVVLAGRYKPMRLRVPGWWETAERDLIDPNIAARYDTMHTARSRKKNTRRHPSQQQSTAQG